MSTEQREHHPFAAIMILLVGTVLIVNLSKGIFDLLAVKQRVIEAEGQVQKLEDENKALEKQYITHTAPAYMEQEIREKLGLARPGEVIVIVPTPAASAAAFLDEGVGEQGADSLPIWQKWLRVLGF